MKIYRLCISPDPSDGEGEDHDEWFSSLELTRRRRSRLIRQVNADPEASCSNDFEIVMYEVAKLPKGILLLAALNRDGWFVSRTSLMPGYTKKATPPADD